MSAIQGATVRGTPEEEMRAALAHEWLLLLLVVVMRDGVPLNAVGMGSSLPKRGALSCSLIRKSFVKSCSENALDDHRAFPLLKTLLNHARRPALAPLFPPHFPVLAPFPAAAGRRVLHDCRLGAERGGWSAGMSPRPFCPNRHRAIQPRPD